MTNIKYAMVGTGLMADLILRDFALSENTELYALVSRESAKAEAKLADLGIDAKALTFDQALIDPQVDVIYIASPHSEHFWMAKAALEAGKHILVEKAFMNSADEAEEIFALAKAKNLFAMEAMWTKFIPLHNHLKELVDSGAIGKLRLIEANFGFPRTYDTSHRLFAKELGGGSSLDQGVYTTTLNRWFADAEISELKATGFNYENGTDATAMTDFVFANGVRGRGNSSLATAFGLGARICGDEAIIEIDEAFWNSTTARIKRYIVDTDRVEIEEISVEKRGAGYVHMLEAVSTSVLAGEIENEKHPHSFTIEVMRALDEVRSQIS